jgi:hypothetical protein
MTLARLLQQQEHAYFLLDSGGGSGEGEAGRASEGESLTDEELCMRLQAQEQTAFRGRLLALAGVGLPEAPGWAGAMDYEVRGPRPVKHIDWCSAKACARHSIWFAAFHPE